MVKNSHGTERREVVWASDWRLKAWGWNHLNAYSHLLTNIGYHRGHNWAIGGSAYTWGVFLAWAASQHCLTSSKYKHLKGGGRRNKPIRIVTVLRFYPSYKTTGQPVTLSWILVEEHEVSGFETLENLALQQYRVSSIIFMLIPTVLNSIE